MAMTMADPRGGLGLLGGSDPAFPADSSLPILGRFAPGGNPPGQPNFQQSLQARSNSGPAGIGSEPGTEALGRTSSHSQGFNRFDRRLLQASRVHLDDRGSNRFHGGQKRIGWGRGE